MGFIIYFNFDVDVDLGPLPQKKLFGLRKTSRMELPINSSKSKLYHQEISLTFLYCGQTTFHVGSSLPCSGCLYKAVPQLSDGIQEFSFPLFSLYSCLSFFNSFLFETGISIEMSLFRLIFVETLERLCDFVQ